MPYMTYKVRLSTKGQLTLPISVRQELNLSPGDDLLLKEIDGKVLLEVPKYKSIDDLFGAISVAKKVSKKQRRKVMEERAVARYEKSSS